MNEVVNLVNQIKVRIQIAAFFLGGSNSSNFADDFSDFDYGLVLNSIEQKEILLMEFEKVFGQVYKVLEKEQSTTFHFFYNNKRFELRVMLIKNIENLIKLLLSGELLNYSQQELLGNLKDGIFYIESEKINKMRSHINYTDSLRQKILKKYIPLLQIDHLKIPILRNDKYLMMKYMFELKQIVLVLSHANVKRFTKSFKHQNKLLNLLGKNTVEIFNSIEINYSNPTLVGYEHLVCLINVYKNELLNGLYVKTKYFNY